MSLKVIHDSLDDIPEAYRELYSERDGKHVLTGVEGMKTQADVDTVRRALENERNEHKSTKAKLGTWGDLDHEDVVKKLDRFSELELAAQGKTEEMDKKLEEMAEARTKTRLAPVERDNKTLKDENSKLREQVADLMAKDNRRQISDAVQAVASKLKVVPSALGDVNMLAHAVFGITDDGDVMTKENPYGITPGLDAEGWLKDMQDKRPHWWPASQGGGAGSGDSGSGSGNPWKGDNMTEQSAYIREHGMEKARALAKAAGKTI